MIDILLIGITLALDAFAVSLSSSMASHRFSLKNTLLMGLWFGAFQFGMPLLGWFLGSTVSGYIMAFDHWIAFALLAFIGGRMVWDTLCSSSDSPPPPPVLSPTRLATLALATSIDALAVGVSMAFMEVDILLSAIVIGVVTFAITMLGGLLGQRLGKLFQRRAALAGGLVLIGIGVKILVLDLMG